MFGTGNKMRESGMRVCGYCREFQPIEMFKALSLRLMRRFDDTHTVLCSDCVSMFRNKYGINAESCGTLKALRVIVSIEEVEELKRMYKKGKTLMEIAERFGVCHSTVRTRLLQNNVKLRVA